MQRKRTIIKYKTTKENLKEGFIASLPIILYKYIEFRMGYYSCNSLILRGILTSYMKLASIAGILAAGLICCWKGNAVLSVFGGILIFYLILRM